MTLNEKAEAIKYLKSFLLKEVFSEVILHKYSKISEMVFVDWLIDKEKEILNQLNPTTNNSVKKNNRLSYSQYLYLIQIIEEFRKEYFMQHIFANGKFFFEQIKESLYKECLPTIRAEKLDELFGDSK